MAFLNRSLQQKKIFFIFLFALFSTCLFPQSERAIFFARAKVIEETNPDSALFYYSKVLTILGNDLRNDTVNFCFCRLVNINIDKTDLQNGFENALQCLKSAELRKDTLKQISALTNLGIILNQQRKFKEAIVFEVKSVILARAALKPFQEMTSLSNLSDMLASVDKHDSGIQVLLDAQLIAREHHFEEEIPNLLANTGNIYYIKAENTGDKKFFRLASDYALQAIEGIKNLKDPTKVSDDYRKDLAYAYGLRGAALAALGNYIESEGCYEKAIPYYTAQKDIYNLSYLYYELTNVYINSGKNAKAVISLRQYDSLSKLIYSRENSKAISEMQTKYETEKKDKQNRILHAENELSARTIKQQKLLTYFIITGLLMAIAFGIFILRGYRQKQRVNVLISKQKREVERQKEIVEEKQKEILDSIHYAQRIQKALLPSEKYIERNLTSYQKK